MEALAQLRKLNNHHTVRRNYGNTSQNKPISSRKKDTNQSITQERVIPTNRSTIRDQVVSQVKDVTTKKVATQKRVTPKEKVIRQVQHTVYDKGTVKEKRYRILLMTLDTAEYPFDDLSQETVYTEWDEGIGFYNYYIGRHLNKEVADRLLIMLKSKGYSVGKIVVHR